MKRWSLLFLVVGLLVGVVAGLLLDKGVPRFAVQNLRGE